MLGKARFLFTLSLACIIFLGVNMVLRTMLYSSRVDLTEGAIYTLSPETINISGALDEPLHIRFFFSEAQANGLPIFQSYAARIRGVLNQLESLSQGRITVESFNPAPFTEEEDLAVSNGLQGIPVDDAGAKFYFGMSIENSTDDRGVMPFFDPARERFLEYDVTRLIHDVANPQRKKLGIISTLPMNGMGGIQMLPSEPWTILAHMKDTFDVEVLSKDAVAIPKDLDVLVLVHPYGLSQATLYNIDQYILHGGKAIFFLDGHLQLPVGDERVSDLAPLLKGWGVSMVAGKVAAEKDAALQVTQPTLESRLRAFPNVTWLEMGEQYLAKDSIVTTSLNKLRFIESGYFTRADDASVTMESLVTTTPAAVGVDVGLLKDGGDPVSLYNNYVPDGKPLILAAQLTGNVQSAFAPEGDSAGYLAESNTPIHVIVVGDSDMLRDEIWVEKQEFAGNSIAMPTADNGVFVINAIEFLAGDDALINLRSRGTEAREFTALAELKQKAEMKFSDQEQRLTAKLKTMEGRMRELQSQQKEGKQLFTPEQQQEISGFRDAFTETRKELRAVQRGLNRDIEQLGRNLALMNIIVVPFTVLIVAFILPLWMRRGKSL